MSFPLALIVLSHLVLTLPAIGQEKGYDALKYSGRIELDRTNTQISGVVTMHAAVTRATTLPKVLQHLKYLAIDSVFVQGVRATIEILDTSSGAYNVIPDPSVVLSTYFDVTTYYHGKPLPEQNSAKWGGVSNRGGMMFAMGVGFAVPYVSCTRHWLPSYDLPDDKVDTTHFIFVCDDDDVVAASGELLGVEELANNRRAYEWRTRYPIATYLMTFAVGPFAEMHISNPLQVPFVAYSMRNSDTTKMRTLMERRVVDALVYFDSLFSPYPFEKVGYVAAPIGSMEHQTMVTIDRRTLDTNNTTAVHELAHMWWGDHVTCHTFDDPWLNEGFATFSESLFLERFFGRQAYVEKQQSNVRSAIKNGSSIPMFGAPAATGHTNNYPSAVIYDKGAAVLGMLRMQLGDSLFFAALRMYGQRHGYSTATSEDLRKAFSDASGLDHTAFFSHWVYGKGYPTPKITITLDGLKVKIGVEQHDTARFRFPLPIVAIKGDLRQGFVFEVDSILGTQLKTQFTFEPDQILIDPDSLVIMVPTVSYASVGASDRKRSPRITLTQLTDSNIRLDLLVPLPSSAQLVVTDVGGKEVYRTELAAQTTSHLFSIDGVASGTYIATIQRLGRVVESATFQALNR